MYAAEIFGEITCDSIMCRVSKSLKNIAEFISTSIISDAVFLYDAVWTEISLVKSISPVTMKIKKLTYFYETLCTGKHGDDFPSAACSFTAGKVERYFKVSRQNGH